MNPKEIASVLGGILIGAAFIPYIMSIVRGPGEPAKSSWIIWATLDTILLAGMTMEHTLNWQVFIATVGAWCVVTLAFKYGTPGWSTLDKACMTVAIIGILIGGILQNPTVSITISLGVMFLASVPTVVSAWKDPAREDRTGWTLIWLSCLATLFSIPAWTMAAAGQPLTFFIIESIMLGILFLRPLALARE